MTDFRTLDNANFDIWLMEKSFLKGLSDEERLVKLCTMILMEDTPEGRARSLIDMANMCISMADKNLGCQITVQVCLALTRQ